MSPDARNFGSGLSAYGGAQVPGPSRTEERANLKAELIRAQIRLTTAQADIEEDRAKIAAMEVAERTDKERDRLVRVGRIRQLDIMGGISPQNAHEWMSILRHWELRDPGEPVTINIMSPGGSVTDGLALHATILRLRRQGHRVTTRGLGLVASMAGVLLQAGDERVMDARAKLLIHEGSTQYAEGASMTVAEAEDMKLFGDMLRSDVLDILTERSTMTKPALSRKWKRRDWTLTASEALRLGFVDRVE